MGRGRRAAAAFRWTAPRRAERSTFAGAIAARRPHAWRRTVLGKASEARAVCRRQPVRWARHPTGCDRGAAGAGGTRFRPLQPDVGAAFLLVPARLRTGTQVRG